MFTYRRVAKERLSERPEEMNPPKPDAAEADVEKHRQNREGIQEWDRRFRELLHSSENVVAFFHSPAGTGVEQDANNASRAAAVVVLELTARAHDDEAQEAMTEISPASLFAAKLTLPWSFKDESKKEVTRLAVGPTQESNASHAISPAPTQQTDIDPPSDNPPRKASAQPQ